MNTNSFAQRQLHAVQRDRCAVIRKRLSVMLLAIISVGCSDSGNPYPVRPDVARQTLQTALDAWKSGTDLGKLREADPQIVVQDLDWSAGTELTAYEIVGEGKAVGANLSVEVHLQLKDTSGGTTQKSVWYVVGTDPALTVFRDMFH